MKLGTRNICEPYIRELLGKINAISELYTYIGTDRPNRYMGSFFPYYRHKHGVEILTNRFNALYKNGSATLDKMIAEIEDIDFNCSNNQHLIEMDFFLNLIRDRWQYVAKHYKETLDEISIYTDEERDEKLKIVETEYGYEIANKIRYRVTKENLISEFKRSQSIFLDIKQIAQSGNQVKVSSKESEEFTINSERLKTYLKVSFTNETTDDGDNKFDFLIADIEEFRLIYNKKKHAALASILYEYIVKPNKKMPFAKWLDIYSECCGIESSTYKQNQVALPQQDLEVYFSYLIPSKSPQ